jgi:hypothetical protein
MASNEVTSALFSRLERNALRRTQKMELIQLESIKNHKY